jgi:hypothetical protein
MFLPSTKLQVVGKCKYYNRLKNNASNVEHHLTTLLICHNGRF